MKQASGSMVWVIMVSIAPAAIPWIRDKAGPPAPTKNRLPGAEPDRKRCTLDRSQSRRHFLSCRNQPVGIQVPDRRVYRAQGAAGIEILPVLKISRYIPVLETFPHTLLHATLRVPEFHLAIGNDIQHIG